MASSCRFMLDSHYSKKTGKSKNVAWLFFLFACIQLLGISGCTNLQTPSLEPIALSLDGIELLPQQGLQQKFKLKFQLQNPNAQTISFQGMKYSLDLNNQKILSGVTNQLPKLAGYSQERVELIAGTQLLGIIRLLNSVASNPNSEFQYNLHATLDVENQFSNMVISESGKVPLLSQ